MEETTRMSATQIGKGKWEGREDRNKLNELKSANTSGYTSCQPWKPTPRNLKTTRALPIETGQPIHTKWRERSRRTRFEIMRKRKLFHKITVIAEKKIREYKKRIKLKRKPTNIHANTQINK